MNSYFVIVSPLDAPLYECEYGPLLKEKTDAKHLNQFILHASLDILDEQITTTQQNYLKIIDKFNEWFVSAYITVSGTRLLLLHDLQNVDGVREVYRRYAISLVT
jgi:trafficking protein particle complex subunit 2